jgi:hypothetical protein
VIAFKGFVEELRVMVLKAEQQILHSLPRYAIALAFAGRKKTPDTEHEIEEIKNVPVDSFASWQLCPEKITDNVHARPPFNICTITDRIRHRTVFYIQI